MSSKIVLVIIAVLIVGAVGWYVVSSGETTEETNVSAPSEEGNVTGARTGEGSLLALLAAGEALECTFTFMAEAGESGEGVGYFAGEQMRVDSTYVIDGQTYLSYYIYSDERMYTWGEMPEGDFAITMPTDYDERMGGESTEWSEAADTPVDIDDEVMYDCQPWSVDASVFVPPTSVQFMDMDAMMQGMMQGVPDMEGMNPEEMEVMMEEMMQGMPQQ